MVKRVLLWVVGVTVAVLLSWGALHILISPVNPEQVSPSGHFDSSCWACHIVTSGVEVTSP